MVNFKAIVKTLIDMIFNGSYTEKNRYDSMNKKEPLTQTERDEKIQTAQIASTHNSLSPHPIANNGWVNDAKKDIPYWDRIIDNDAVLNPIDWNWLAKADLMNGVGTASLMNIENMNANTALAFHDADVDILTTLDNLYARMSTSFMFDNDRVVKSYRLARSVAYAKRRLKDEIERLEMRLDALNAEYNNVEITEKENEKERSRVWRQETKDISAKSTGKDEKTWKYVQTLTSDPDKQEWAYNELIKRSRRYLPGQQANSVFGIDVETTGLMNDYIVDIGYEYMDVSPTEPVIMHSDAINDDERMFVKDYYRADGAYGAGRQMFGVSENRLIVGNKVAELTGIETGMIADKIPFDEDLQAQHALLAKLESAPVVAHNARFEHQHFLASIDGYAEAYRDGRITIMDTMFMSSTWDKNGEERIHGANKLDSYAKRWNALHEDDNERHLGYEDTHIMLVAMKNHLNWLHENNDGPWNTIIPITGIGGKRYEKHDEKQ